jgi:hypothetical protein
MGLRLSKNLFFILHFIPNGIHHPDSIITPEHLSIAMIKMPVQTIEWTCILADFLLGIESATLAIITH